MLFLIYQRPELTEANYLNDGFWGDAIEELPDGSLIMVPDIKLALDGEPYDYIPNGERHKVSLPPVDKGDFFYYHSIHRYYQKFGLPHGKGWIHELPWVPNFLAYFDDLKNVIESWQVSNSDRRGNVDNNAFL